MKFHKFIIGFIGILMIVFSIFGYMFLMVVATLIVEDYGWSYKLIPFLPLIPIILGMVMSLVWLEEKLRPQTKTITTSLLHANSTRI